MPLILFYSLAPSTRTPTLSWVVVFIPFCRRARCHRRRRRWLHDVTLINLFSLTLLSSLNRQSSIQSSFKTVHLSLITPFSWQISCTLSLLISRQRLRNHGWKMEMIMTITKYTYIYTSFGDFFERVLSLITNGSLPPSCEREYPPIKGGKLGHLTAKT